MVASRTDERKCIFWRMVFKLNSRKYFVKCMYGIVNEIEVCVSEYSNEPVRFTCFVVDEGLPIFRCCYSSSLILNTFLRKKRINLPR